MSVRCLKGNKIYLAVLCHLSVTLPSPEEQSFFLKQQWSGVLSLILPRTRCLFSVRIGKNTYVLLSLFVLVRA